MDEQSLAELEHLYTYYGLTHLMAGLQTILLRKWDSIKDDPILRQHAADILKESHRLQQFQAQG